jgi:hypothetical protein
MHTRRRMWLRRGGYCGEGWEGVGDVVGWANVRAGRKGKETGHCVVVCALLSKDRRGLVQKPLRRRWRAPGVVVGS